MAHLILLRIDLLRVILLFWYGLELSIFLVVQHNHHFFSFNVGFLQRFAQRIIFFFEALDQELLVFLKPSFDVSVIVLVIIDKLLGSIEEELQLIVNMALSVIVV